MGVDIFFVISGYLIASLVFEEVATTGNISLSAFWLRRARRILPALFFMLGGVSLLAWIFFFGTSLLPQYAASLLAALLSVSNILFYSQHGYFDSVSITKPLLHTWSLGVEEQFYLFFPLILYGLLVWAKLRRTAVLASFLVVIAVSCVTCFLITGGLEGKRDAFSFFMLPTRLWELLAGATLAYTEREHLLPKLKKNFCLILEVAALAVLVFCLLYAEKALGIWNVLIVLSTIILLYAKNGYAASVLSLRPFVAIGKLSYSLYLWHWPFLVFASLYLPSTAVGGGVKTVHKISLLLLTLVCAYLSYRYVEQPMRKPWIGWKQVGTRLGPVFVGLCAIGLCALLIKLPPAFETPGDLAQYPPSVKCSEYKNSDATLSVLHNGEFNGQFDFVVIGDSHAGSFGKILFDFAGEHNLQGGLLTSMFFQPETQRVVECFPIARLANDFIEERGIKTILVAQSWTWYMYRSRMYYEGKMLSRSEQRELIPALIKRHLQKWLDAGVTVFLLEQVPEHPYASIEMAAFFTHSTPSEKLTTRNGFLEQLFLEINHQNLYYIPTHEPFRKRDDYFFIEDGKLLYDDNNHVNYFGTHKLIPAFSPFFKHILSTKQ